MNKMQLRDYQQKIAGEADNLLRCFGIAYLCMEVRTGKTLTAFHAAWLYGAKKVLFVTKLKAISGIRKDFDGSGANMDLYLINYEQLHKCEADFDLVILDECHCLGQYPSPAERTKELRRICTGKPIIYLSGTPSPESFSQFFFQFWVSSFSPWKDYPTFWVAVQLSMIMLEQAEAIEVFLPYVYDPATNQTFFNKLKDGGFKMLPSSVK